MPKRRKVIFTISMLLVLVLGTVLIFPDHTNCDAPVILGNRGKADLIIADLISQRGGLPKPGVGATRRIVTRDNVHPVEEWEYVRIFYASRTALSTESFTFYVGQDVGQDTNVPVDFGRSRADAISHFETVMIAGQSVEVELLTRSQMPDQGIALFQIDDTHVVIQWQGVDAQTMLALLEESTVHLSPNDLALITDIDNAISAIPE